jgi:hypothetical protein
MLRNQRSDTTATARLIDAAVTATISIARFCARENVPTFSAFAGPNPRDEEPDLAFSKPVPTSPEWPFSVKAIPSLISAQVDRFVVIVLGNLRLA